MFPAYFSLVGVCCAGSVVAFGYLHPWKTSSSRAISSLKTQASSAPRLRPTPFNRPFVHHLHSSVYKSSQSGSIHGLLIPTVLAGLIGVGLVDVASAYSDEDGKGGSLELDESNPFVDLSDEVHFDTQFGLMSIAFHPKFTQNGRFFASFNCDKQQWPGCAGRCSCNSDLKCDPSKLPHESGAQPCRYQAVVAEFTANGTTASSRPSEAKSTSAGEVRRIFTMGLPFTAHHAGQNLFGPANGYLYFMMGDGGGSSSSDPYGFAQNKKSLLRKILRLDIDNIPSKLVTN